ncbi:MAG: DUF4125 family protein [Clostridiales bacterium]|nr:DUF4125 family protein [Clostridiales bacterium]
MDKKSLVSDIIRLEWEMFTTTRNAGGRASCQDDKTTFEIMRGAQHEVWSLDTLISYRNDLEQAKQQEINLVAIKYARMMKLTFPDEYERIEHLLPPVTENAGRLADEISKRHTDRSLAAAKEYPKLISMGRPVTTESSRAGHWAAMDNYLHSELLTYSEATLELCLRDTLRYESRGVNMALLILENTAVRYGYPSLDALEAALP